MRGSVNTVSYTWTVIFRTLQPQKRTEKKKKSVLKKKTRKVLDKRTARQKSCLDVKAKTNKNEKKRNP